MGESQRDRAAQILMEATRLFGMHGYRKVTIKQLAAACGITEAALYRHFDSKEAIYRAVLDSLETRLESDEIFKQLAEAEDIDSFLRGVAEHILDFFGANEEVYRLLLYSALEGHERANHVFRVIRGRYVGLLIRKFGEMYKAGWIVQKNNEITARCFTGMVFDCALGFSLWKGMQGREYTPSEVVANNIPIYVNGLKKR